MRLTRAAPARPTSIRTLPTVRPAAPLTAATSESRVFVFGGRRAAVRPAARDFRGFVRAVFFLAMALRGSPLYHRFPAPTTSCLRYRAAGRMRARHRERDAR